jgi:hypothetical protein
MDLGLVFVVCRIGTAQGRVVLNLIVRGEVGQVERIGIVVLPNEVGEVIWHEEAELLMEGSSVLAVGVVSVHGEEQTVFAKLYVSLILRDSSWYGMFFPSRGRIP